MHIEKGKRCEEFNNPSHQNPLVLRDLIEMLYKTRTWTPTVEENRFREIEYDFTSKFPLSVIVIEANT